MKAATLLIAALVAALVTPAQAQSYQQQRRHVHVHVHDYTVNRYHYHNGYNHNQSRDAARVLLGVAAVAGVAAVINSQRAPAAPQYNPYAQPGYVPQQYPQYTQPQAVNPLTCSLVPIIQDSRIIAYQRSC